MNVIYNYFIATEESDKKENQATNRKDVRCPFISDQLRGNRPARHTCQRQPPPCSDYGR